MSKQYLHHAIPFAIYFLAYFLSNHFGYHEIDIPWSYYQLLDREELINIPFKSLYLLHSQPPLLNALLALLLKLAAISNNTPQFWANNLFIFLGLISTVLLFRIVIEMTNSLAFAVVSITLILTDPAYYFFQNLFFYPFLLNFLLIVLLFAAIRVVKTGKQSALMLSAVLLSLICNARSLFHPIWAIVIYALLLVMLYITRGERRVFKLRNVVSPTIVLGLLIIIWPLKNYVLFNQFTFSTWEGFNLAKGTGVHSDILNEYISSGTVPEEFRDEILNFQEQQSFMDTDIFVIAEPEKSDGSRNWNHYIFTKVNQPLKREAFLFRITNPKQWLEHMVSNYFAWTRPSYIHPFTGGFRGPDNALYTKYSKFHQGLFFYDIRPFLEHNISILAERQFFYVRNAPLPFTVFGMLTFPLLMLVSLIVAIWKLKKMELLEFTIMLIPLFTIFWLLVVPVLTDGIEGNRMRFSGTPYLVILLIMIFKELCTLGIQRPFGRDAEEPMPK